MSSVKICIMLLSSGMYIHNLRLSLTVGTITKRKTREQRNENGKLIKHSRTRYRAEIFIQGNPRVSRTFHDKKVAEKWIRDTEDLMRSGQFAQVNESRKHTVASIVDRYLEEVVPSLRSHETIQTQMIWWKHRLGQINLSALNPALVLEARDELMRGDRGPATVNRYLANFSSLCSHAMRHWQLLSENPVSKVPKLKEPPGRVRFLDDDEKQRLLKAAESISKSLHLAVVLALSTEARRMNVWSLSWHDIELTNGKETVTFAKTKNDSTVILPLAGKVIKLLLDYRKVRRLDTNLLFPSRVDANKAIDFKAPFARALKQAEIEDFRWHDLRHSAASYLAQQGVDLRRIAAILGHKSLSMSLRYSHLNVEHLREDLEKMTSRI